MSIPYGHVHQGYLNGHQLGYRPQQIAWQIANRNPVQRGSGQTFTEAAEKAFENWKEKVPQNFTEAAEKAFENWKEKVPQNFAEVAEKAIEDWKTLFPRPRQAQTNGQRGRRPRRVKAQPKRGSRRRQQSLPSSSSSQSSSDELDPEAAKNLAVGLMAVGAAGAVAYGAKKVYDWFTERPEDASMGPGGERPVNSERFREQPPTTAAAPAVAQGFEEELQYAQPPRLTQGFVEPPPTHVAAPAVAHGFEEKQQFSVSMFPPGRLVLVTGLPPGHQLNGKRGVVQGYNPLTGAVEVRLNCEMNGLVYVNLRPENLVRSLPT
uniref:Uncharacterized protein n=1 Tax=Chromera velia CCMP2878 TaxID=1169474 RepID=A0A0G4F168_9ALVE|eukprot:Cvel_14622.t1-p1 / transcript=Cvel_14622.t1 / gene=Cvel_14622 / organism=Chromera_velia_CCMP2878 / gene_product=hypothetical protein / transcript_product=hypothetical protein / location=Cvel_scaffold1046:20109-21378(+) / protein_length=319 / sequence_SO=supercontig / SO=protein_coding / is_pseudo=false